MNKKEKEFFKPLAEKFAAGYISWISNIGMDYAMKRYVTPESVIGDFWFEVAETVALGMKRLQEVKK